MVIRPNELTFNLCSNCQATDMPLKQYKKRWLCAPCTDFVIRMEKGRKMKAYDDKEMDEFRYMLTRLDG